jgi:pilus assembly protein CpaB
MVPVLVAKADILSGIPLDDTNTDFRDFPEANVPEGAVTKATQFKRRALKVSAVSGEMIMLAKLGEEGEIGASAQIPNGMRVVTCPVTSTTTHAGQMAPGDRVDLIVTYKHRDSGSGELMSMSRTILEYIKVFSVDAQRERTDDMGDTHAKNVSLLVTPSEAQLVMLAKDKGVLHLAMRSKNDTETAKASPIDEEALFGSLRQPVNQLPIQKRPDVDDEITGSDETPEEIIRRKLLDEQNQQITQTKPSVDVRPILDPDAPRWQVTVYSGSDKHVEEFELPLETETD